MQIDIPWVTADQMREIDRLMMEKYNIELIQMMELAGYNLAQLSRSNFLDGDPRNKHIAILAGTGGNGGGGLVCARHLHNWGAKVTVLLSKKPNQYNGIPLHQLSILQSFKPKIITFKKEILSNSSFNLILDCIIGYSLIGNPRNLPAQMIRWANKQNTPILSLDTPSGIDTTTGIVYDPTILADATLTLALPKIGLKSKEANKNLGELYLADIGVPIELYSESTLNLKIENIFFQKSIIKLAL